MERRPSLILVTGVTGFLGSHLVLQLLKAGHRVRGTARSGKLHLAQTAYAKYGEQCELVVVDDLIHCDFTSILQGVDGVLHQAAPVAGKEQTLEAQLDVAVQGSLNILRQAEKAGIKIFVLASSYVTLFDWRQRPISRMLNDGDWNPATRDEALSGSYDSMFVYCAEKTLQERAVWEFADQHPNLNITTVNPPFFFGPFVPGFMPRDATGLNANEFIYALLDPEGLLFSDVAMGVDIRDVARAMISALSAPHYEPRKRLLISGEWFSWREAADHIASVRPHLHSRLSTTALRAPSQPVATLMDTKRARELLAIEFTPWKTTITDAVDSLLEAEELWSRTS